MGDFRGVHLLLRAADETWTGGNADLAGRNTDYFGCLQGQTLQESPRDVDYASKGLLPKMKSINWNQDLSGTAISQHETFDEDDSTDGSDRRAPQCLMLAAAYAAAAVR